MTLLDVRGVTLRYKTASVQVTATERVSFQVDQSDRFVLLGPSGCGKSTLLKAVGGYMRPSEGEIRFAGETITGLPAHKLARRGIGYVPEDRRIFRLLTVTENLRTGLDRHGVSDERKHKLLDKVFAYFPILAERRTQLGGTLSGGEQQMLAIARAMMLEPKIILLDITLPDMEVCDFMPALGPLLKEAGIKPPVIGLISKDSTEQWQICRQAGLADAVAKPLSPEAIDRVLRKHLLLEPVNSASSSKDAA